MLWLSQSQFLMSGQLDCLCLLHHGGPGGATSRQVGALVVYGQHVLGSLSSSSFCGSLHNPVHADAASQLPSFWCREQKMKHRSGHSHLPPFATVDISPNPSTSAFVLSPGVKYPERSSPRGLELQGNWWIVSGLPNRSLDLEISH